MYTNLQLVGVGQRMASFFSACTPCCHGRLRRVFTACVCRCVVDGFLNTNMKFPWLIYASLSTYCVTSAVTVEFSNEYAWTFGCANFCVHVYMHYVAIGVEREIPLHCRPILWPPYVIGQAMFSSCRLFFFLLFFFPRLISAVADWMSTILAHMVWP